MQVCVVIQRRAPQQWQRLGRLLLFSGVDSVEGLKLGSRDGGGQYYRDGETHGYRGRIVMTGESTFTQVSALLKGSAAQRLHQVTIDVDI